MFIICIVSVANIPSMVCGPLLCVLGAISLPYCACTTSYIPRLFSSLSRCPNLLQRQSQAHHVPMLNANHMLNIPAMKHEEQESNLSPLQQIKSMQPMQPMQPQHLASMVIPRLPSREQINHYPLDIQQQSQQIVGTVGGGEIERQPYEFTYMPVPSNAADRDLENFNFQNDPFSAGLHD